MKNNQKIEIGDLVEVPRRGRMDHFLCTGIIILENGRNVTFPEEYKILFLDGDIGWYLTPDVKLKAKSR
jgi:hypothetical protein